MSESFNYERALFPKTYTQRLFMQQAVNSIGDVKKAGRLLGVSDRTVRDWLREKNSIPLKTVYALSMQSGVSAPRSLKTTSLLDHLSRAGKKGGRALVEKYGSVVRDEKKRQRSWAQWWKKHGRHQHLPILMPLPVHLPRKTTRLAEFVGIMLGDGGIAPYRIAISLNSKADAEYIPFVSRLVYELFGIVPRHYRRKKSLAVDLVVHRKELVSFCRSVGLPLRSKMNADADIPLWISKHQSLSRACVRGLVDTDGCVFVHRYCVKGKTYSYAKVSFSSASTKLLDFVACIFNESGIIAGKRYTAREVRIDGQESVARFFRLIGSSNPKHVAVWKGRVAANGKPADC